VTEKRILSREVVTTSYNGDRLTTTVETIEVEITWPEEGEPRHDGLSVCSSWTISERKAKP